MELTESVYSLIEKQVSDCGRPDLFRAPLCAFSAANNPLYAELKTVIGDWHCHPTELLPDAQSVISFFIPFTPEVAQSAKQETPVSPLWGEAYLVANALLNQIGRSLADMLIAKGFSALSFAATHTYDSEKLQSAWSHRSAAVIAGLGSFGVNRMLITNKGSAGRLGTVLTSAVIAPSPSPAPDRCLYQKTGDCLLCLEACPVGALGQNSFAPFTCHDRLLENGALLSHLGTCDVCGKCVANCPLASLE